MVQGFKLPFMLQQNFSDRCVKAMLPGLMDVEQIIHLNGQSTSGGFLLLAGSLLSTKVANMDFSPADCKFINRSSERTSMS